MRMQDDDYLVHEAKEMEEQKRLFYVAVTRAEEALILTGHQGSGDNSFLGFLTEGLGLQERDGTIVTDSDIKGLAMLTEEDIEMLYDYADKREAAPADRRRVEVVPLSMPKRSPWKSVTEAVEVRRRHGEGWMVLGDVMHRIFEGISKGDLKEQDITAHAERLLESKGVHGKERDEKTAIIEKDISTLKGKGVWQEIIMPAENSFTELPFILEAGESVYNGRIDRVIKENDTYKIYDYKTFPVKEEEVGYLLKEYSFQMNMYKKAVKELFNTTSVKSFIVFTHTGGIYEV